METIKIGRTEYGIKKGDYIIYNGACHQFCSGDGRTLKQEGFSTYRNIIIPKTLVKKINLDKLRKVETKIHGVDIIKYYF
jgi:hypothetical protein